MDSCSSRTRLWLEKPNETRRRYERDSALDLPVSTFQRLRTRYELAEVEPTLYSWTIPDCACRMSVSAWIAHALPACLPWTRLQAHLLRIPPVKLVGTSIRGPAIVYTIAAASAELS